MERPSKFQSQFNNGDGFEKLDDYFNRLEKGESTIAEETHKLKLKLDEQRIENQKRAVEDFITKQYELENKLGLKNIKSNSALRKKAIDNFNKEQDIANAKQSTEYWKQYSKEYQKQRNKELKQAKQEESIAKLRSTVLEDGTEKTKGQQFVDNLGASFIEGLSKWGVSLTGTLKKSFDNIVSSLNNLSNAVNNSISTYASYQTSINARLQGVSEDINQFSKIEDTLQKVSYSPLIRTELLYNNLSSLVSEGIASNVEQRAFLQTVKEGIATTFDANNSALLRLIRLQQYDSTAARLGLESYLTRFLNEFVQNTEYLNNTFDTVASSLLEASALLGARESTEFEYIVQKWLGTLTGVGLSENTASSIAQAIGYLGSGDVNALSGSNLQNLIVMAATRAGLDYSQLLTSGLNAYNVNQLLGSMTEYLQLIGSQSSNVVKSQYAQAFGVSVSDLVAASKLSKGDLQAVMGNMLSYTGMYDELAMQMNLMNQRIHTSTILENLFNNLQFGLGAQIASTPEMYATWKIADMLQNVTGGTGLPFVGGTVEGLVKLGLLAGAAASSVGDILSGFKTWDFGRGDVSSMLSLLGINKSSASNTLVRGTGLTSRVSGMSTSISTVSSGLTSSSSLVGPSFEDISTSVVETKKETIEDNTANIYDLLNEANLSSKLQNIVANTQSIDNKLDNISKPISKIAGLE